MATTKKQHYVPKFYLRRFTKNPNTINLYNLSRRVSIFDVSLKHQCYQSYFYDKDNFIENQLKIIEDNVSVQLCDITASRKLPKQGTNEYAGLLLFAIVQHERTLSNVKNRNLLFKQVSDYYKSFYKDAPQSLIDDYIGQMKYQIYPTLMHWIEVVPLGLDLKMKLFVNNTGTEFITSDNPVVYYNQYLEDRTFASNTAISIVGTQLFFPLDPNHLLYIYDSNIYEFKNDSSDFIIIDNKEDILEMNRLQFVHCHENLYFLSLYDNVKQIHEELAEHHSKHVTTIKVHENYVVDDTRGNLLQLSLPTIRIGLNVSCIRINKNALNERKKQKKAKMQPVVLLRDAEKLELYPEFIYLARKGKYNIVDFDKYIQQRKKRIENLKKYNSLS